MKAIFVILPMVILLSCSKTQTNSLCKGYIKFVNITADTFHIVITPANFLSMESFDVKPHSTILDIYTLSKDSSILYQAQLISKPSLVTDSTIIWVPVVSI